VTCAKTVVKATLTCLSGRAYRGENSCNNPQTSCPRAEGEGYSKCLSICKQPMHAEIQAMSAAIDAGDEIRGGHMSVHHDKVCSHCIQAMAAYGITWTTNKESP
jgi:hypothetical protein